MSTSEPGWGKEYPNGIYYVCNQCKHQVEMKVENPKTWLDLARSLLVCTKYRELGQAVHIIPRNIDDCVYFNYKLDDDSGLNKLKSIIK